MREEGLAASWPRAATKALGLAVGVGLGRASELDEEKAVAGRKELEVFEQLVLLAHGVEEIAVHAFEADRLVRQKLRNVVGRDEDVVKADADQRAVVRTLHQVRSVAPRMTAQVPSLPTSARATLKPLSGRSSSRLKPETRRGILGNCARTSSA